MVEDRANEADVFRFKAKVVEDNGQPAIVLPVKIAKEFPPQGQSTIEGTINNYAFRTPLEPNESGLLVKVKETMLKGGKAKVGDQVEVAMLGPEPEPIVPDDLKRALADSRKAQSLWKNLTAMNRRDWIRWVTLAKAEETRARRIRRTVDQLAEGKRRACCVNVYEYMFKLLDKK